MIIIIILCTLRCIHGIAKPDPVSTISSNQDTSKYDFQEESGTSSTNYSDFSDAKPLVTNSFELNPTTFTPTEQQAAVDTTNDPPGDTKIVANGPPSYSFLYHS